MELVSRGLIVDRPESPVNQPFDQRESKKALFAQKIAKIFICLAEVARSLTKLSGKADLFMSSIDELPTLLHGGGKPFGESKVLARFRDGLHTGSQGRVPPG